MLNYCQFYTVRHLITFKNFAFHLVQNIWQYCIFNHRVINEELVIWELLSLCDISHTKVRKSQLAIVLNTAFRGYAFLVCQFSGLLRSQNGHPALGSGRALVPAMWKRGRECGSASSNFSMGLTVQEPNLLMKGPLWGCIVCLVQIH